MSELKPCGMNYFEAGMKLEVMQSEYAHIRKNDAEWEAIETAKEALHEAWNRRAHPANEPLTQIIDRIHAIPTETFVGPYGDFELVEAVKDSCCEAVEEAYARKPEEATP